MTQYELAKNDMNRTTIAKIESPDTFYSMTLNTLFRLCVGLDKTMKKLFDFRDEQDLNQYLY